MSYPILASSSTWYTQGGTTVTKSTITSIEIKNSYTPTSTVTSSWDASAAKDGSVMVYIEGAKLTIAGNGSGKIYMNENSGWAFADFSSATKIIDAHILDTSRVTNMQQMFQNDKKLTEVDVSTWNTSNVTRINHMFNYCNALITVNVSNWDTGNILYMNNVFAYCNNLIELDCSNWNTSKVRNMSWMFFDCNSLKTIGDTSNWNTSSVTDMSYMFYHCTSLQVLDVSNWDTSNVTTMRCMFLQSDYGVTSAPLSVLDVSKWDVSKVTRMDYIFYGLTNITTLPVENWDLSSCTSLHHMFAWCTRLVLNDKVSNWNTSNVLYMNAVFHSNMNTHLDLSKWDVSKVQTFSQMFERNTVLEEIIGLDKWNTSSAKTFAEMFSGCSSLRELDLSAFNTTTINESWKDPVNSETSGVYGMFGISGDSYSGMHKLQKVTIGENFSFNGDGTCTNIPVLPTPNVTHITGADGYWYEPSGNTLLASEISSKVAKTYYGSPELVRDFSVLVKTGSLIDIGKEIRNKTNTDTRYKPSEMATAINELSSSIVAVIENNVLIIKEEDKK
ncbi:MAG: BspA family leucine-rich repeat surface protein [Erysipelotrichaceae bacterium]|nr:BspA family leucine-rich repeat surface protein [Erysipelotrichaceae bacterium]